MDPDTVRWSVTVTKETDAAVRSFLGQRGFRKGDLSKFIEEAVRWRVLNETVEEVRRHNAEVSPDELQAAIDDAVAVVRAERFATRV